MRRWNRTSRMMTICTLWGILGLFLRSGAGYAESSDPIDRAEQQEGAVVQPELSGAAPRAFYGRDLTERMLERAGQLAGQGIAWYRRTPPPERATWGGLAACAGLGLVVLLERMVRLRRRRVIPGEFTARFVDRLHEGKLDCG